MSSKFIHASVLGEQSLHVVAIIGMVRGGGVKQVVAHSHVFGSAEGEGGQRWQDVVVRAPTGGQAAVSGCLLYTSDAADE